MSIYSYRTSSLALALSGLLALAIAMGIGRFALTPILPLMQAQQGLSLEAGSYLAAANYVGYLIGALVAARWPQGLTQLMRSGLCLVVLSTAGMAASGPDWWFLGLRFLAGVASAWVLVASASLCVAELVAQGDKKGECLVFSGVGLGIALTGLYCALALWLQLSVAIVWLGLASLALGACALLGVGPAWPGGRPVAASPSRFPQTQGQTGIGKLVVCYGLFGFAYILPATYLPLQARELLNASPLFVWVWPVFGLSAAGSMLALYRLLGWPRRRLWAGAQVLMATGIALPLLFPGWLSLTLAALCVGSTFMVITLLGLQEVRALMPEKAAQSVAYMTASFALGQWLGPVVVKLLLQCGASLNVALYVGVLCLCLSAAWLWFSQAKQVPSSARPAV